MTISSFSGHVLGSEDILANSPFGKSKNYFKDQNKKEINIDGVIENIKKSIRARSNIVNFDITDGDYKISVSMYTINWLKRANLFDCSNGDIVNLVAKPFKYIGKDNHIGKILIKNKATKFTCKNSIQKIEDND